MTLQAPCIHVLSHSQPFLLTKVMHYLEEYIACNQLTKGCMHKFVRLVESLRAGVSEPGAWRIRERKVEVRDVQCPDPLMPGTVTQNSDAGRTGAGSGTNHTHKNDILDILELQ